MGRSTPHILSGTPHSVFRFWNRVEMTFSVLLRMLGHRWWCWRSSIWPTSLHNCQNSRSSWEPKKSWRVITHNGIHFHCPMHVGIWITTTPNRRNLLHSVQELTVDQSECGNRLILFRFWPYAHFYSENGVPTHFRLLNRITQTLVVSMSETDSVKDLQIKFPRPDDGFPQLTKRMGIGRHQSWTEWPNISSRTRESFTLTRYDHHSIGFISWPQFK
jgi:hypothetical protein